MPENTRFLQKLLVLNRTESTSKTSLKTISVLRKLTATTVLMPPERIQIERNRRKQRNAEKADTDEPNV